MNSRVRFGLFIKFFFFLFRLVIFFLVCRLFLSEVFLNGFFWGFFSLDCVLFVDFFSVLGIMGLVGSYKLLVENNSSFWLSAFCVLGIRWGV